MSQLPEILDEIHTRDLPLCITLPVRNYIANQSEYIEKIVFSKVDDLFFIRIHLEPVAYTINLTDYLLYKATNTRLENIYFSPLSITIVISKV